MQLAARTGFEPVNAALRGLWLNRLPNAPSTTKNIAQAFQNFYKLHRNF